MALAESRKVTRRVRKIGDSKPDAQSMTPQVPQQVETKRLDEKSATPEKKVLAPTENTLLDVPTTQPQGNFFIWIRSFIKLKKHLINHYTFSKWRT